MEETDAWQDLELAWKATLCSRGGNRETQDPSTVTSKCEDTANGARVHMQTHSLAVLIALRTCGIVRPGRPSLGVGGRLVPSSSLKQGFQKKILFHTEDIE